MSNGHARLAPSSAGRWGFCPGSVGMEERYPDEGDEGSAGEASHWVGSELLQGRVHNPGETAPNGVVLDHEMVQGATFYAKAACNAVSVEQPFCWCVEQPLTVPSVHTDCWGTPDLWYYLPIRRELHVWDYKFGWKIVDVIGNKQLTCYSAGALALLPAELFAPGAPDITVVFHIVQPRPNHPLGAHREWRTTWSELRGIVQQLSGAAQAALSPDPIVTSGHHCYYCNARHACPAARKSLYAAIDYSERACPHDLDPEGLGVELAVAYRAAEAIKYILTGLEAQAVGLIAKGVPVPGWSVERGQGRFKWKVPVQQVFALGDLHGVSLRAPEVAITPAQAKMAGIPIELINSFADTPLGDPKLVKSTSSLLAQVFGPAAAARNR